MPGCDLHHLHVWEVRPGRRLMTAHVQMADQPLSEVDTLLDKIRGRLHERWNITHATLEAEFAGCGSDALLGSGLVSGEQEEES